MSKAKQTRNPIPYQRVAKLWDAGKSYEFIGKNIGRLAKSGDTTKPIRAIVSRMLNQGWTDKDGKNHTLQPREGMRNIGVGKTMHKVSAKPVTTSKKTAGAKPKAGKPVVIELHDSGKFVRLQVGSTQTLAKSTKLIPVFTDVLDQLGYVVTKKADAPVAEVETEAPAAPTVAESTGTGEAIPVDVEVEVEAPAAEAA